jgi:prepilin-type processing-associated H-X9-DG protein
MPIEIRELHIKAVIAPQDDALLSFGPADSAGKGGHTGGINMVFADGSVRATDDDGAPIDTSFAAPDAGPVPVEELALNYVKIRLDHAGTDGSGSFGLF